MLVGGPNAHPRAEGAWNRYMKGAGPTSKMTSTAAPEIIYSFVFATKSTLTPRFFFHFSQALLDYGFENRPSISSFLDFRKGKQNVDRPAGRFVNDRRVSKTLCSWATHENPPFFLNRAICFKQ